MIVSATCLITLLLIIWFKTNAFVEYAQLLKVDKLVKVDEYELVVIQNNSDQSFPDFLNEYHNSFFTRLLNCPICTSVWLGIFLSLFIGITSFPTITLFGLGLYLIISKLL